MELKEVKNLKLDTEGRITNIVGTMVNEFQKKTGVSIKSISIYFVDVSSLGSEKSDYIISGCKMDLDLCCLICR